MNNGDRVGAERCDEQNPIESENDRGGLAQMTLDMPSESMIEIAHRKRSPCIRGDHISFATHRNFGGALLNALSGGIWPERAFVFGVSLSCLSGEDRMVMIVA